ncbi:MAG: DNA cytosine methyltransferase [Ruminococcus sp.]|nr:DNA cytosine methyltransferase [Ruminococcus sp.]
MTFIDLFAGVGGFRRGMELAGHKCMGFCEFDKFAVASYTSMHLITEEQRRYLATFDLKKRQKEILKDEYRNGEWYSPDIRSIRADDVPRVDCWCFGAPCQDFSIAGKRAGLDGDRSSLVREVFRILGEIREEDRPEWLIYENVKGMLSSNKGFDYLVILLELDELGYDCEWQIFNSKYHDVPQNRERVYTIGHLRTGGRKQIFPLCGSDKDNSADIKQIGSYKAKRANPNRFRCYDSTGIAPTLGCMEGGGLEPHIVTLIDMPPLLKAQTHGMDNDCIPAIWNEKYNSLIAIRKITPKECFRLQGWTGDYFEKARFVNSDSQLYKQAGNGVTVTVVEDIGEALCQQEKI